MSWKLHQPIYAFRRTSMVSVDNQLLHWVMFMESCSFVATPFTFHISEQLPIFSDHNLNRTFDEGSHGKFPFRNKNYL